MIALCKYCKMPISDHDMAKTDKEKELTGGGAKYVGHLGNALFAHEDCYNESEDKGK
jgi:hypothetical protein